MPRLLRGRRILALCALTAACTGEAPGQRAALRGSTAVALSCRSATTGVRPLTECVLGDDELGNRASRDLRALVLNQDLGELAVASVQTNRYLDTLPGVPGITHIPVGDAPTDVAVGHSGEFAYVLNAGSETVSIVDLEGTCEAGVLPLQGRPASMLIDPAGTLYLTYPELGEVAIIDLDDCDVAPGICTPGEVADEVGTRPGADGGVGQQGPACANGRDDDGDGLIDASDPGCDDDADGDETDAAALPGRCADGLDNDGDGLIDRADPGCERASDDSETDAFPPLGDQPTPACADGEDNDGDGRVDWPADPGCAAAGDSDEAPVVTACADGFDNDDTGGIDGDDAGCTAPTDESEAGCDDAWRIRLTRVGGEETDGAPVELALSPDGRTLYVGHADRSYVSVVDLSGRPTVVREIGVTSACANDLDDDGDGQIDHPADSGCSDALDDSEGPADHTPQCADGLDNNGDGLTDLADPGCESAADPVERALPGVAQCHNGVDDDGDGLVDLLDPGCRHEGDLDERDDDPDPDLQPACSDGIDNDGDGVADLEDSGCHAAGDEVEGEPPGHEEGASQPCAAGGVGCVGPGDLRAAAAGDVSSEPGRVEIAGTPPCSDGLDNDGDGLSDWPDDPDCEDADDRDEFRSSWTAACADGVDNDGDGATDWPDDTDCAAQGARSEATPPPACSDGLDNDGDGLVDAEADPGCVDAQGAWEDEVDQVEATVGECPAPQRSPARSGNTSDPAISTQLWCPPAPDALLDPPHCNDGRDNDRDGLIDDEDPGCASPWDGDEAGVGRRPDPCQAAGRQCGGFVGAVPTGPRPAACADGLDNDGDGSVDPVASDDAGQLSPRCSAADDLSEAAPSGFRYLLEGLDVAAVGDPIEPVALRGGVAGLAVTPDGGSLYVLDRAFGWLAVVDIASGALVDTRTQTPFHRSQGIEIPGVPVGIEFACFGAGEAEPCDATSPDVVAYVTGTEGEVRVIRVRRGGEAIHLADDSRSQLRAQADQPEAFRGDGSRARFDNETPPSDVPFVGRSPQTFFRGGAQGVEPASERGPDDPSGFDFGSRSVTDGTWTAAWQGALPGSRRSTGQLRTVRTTDAAGGGTTSASAVVLEDELANFCSVGIRPGDRLVLLSDLDADNVAAAARPSCERVFSPEALTGREGPEWCITDVRRRRLALRAAPRRLPDGVDRAGGVCPIATPGNLLDPLPAGAPLQECFAELVEYRVRVGDEFVVSRSGTSRISHNWTAGDDGQCVLRSDAHPLRVGRARLCRPGGVVPCERFENEALSMTLFAPPDTEVAMERDMAVRFFLSGATFARTYPLGTITTDVAVDPNTGKAYVTESGFEDLWLLDAESNLPAFVIGR